MRIVLTQTKYIILGTVPGFYRLDELFPTLKKSMQTISIGLEVMRNVFKKI